MNKALTSISSVGLALLLAACGGGETPEGTGGTGSGTGGAGAAGGAGGASGSSGAGGAMTTGGAGGSSGASTTGGAGGSASGAGGAGATSGTGGASGSAGTPGVGGASGGMPATGGSSGMGGSDVGGQSGSAGMAGGAGAPPMVTLPPLVTSANGAYWKTDGMLADSTAAATVTVNSTEAQTWEGFGGSFNELGWTVLTSQAMKDEAIKLLFDAADGCNFVWGRIPMGASDYATSRYSLNDTGTDVTPNSGESNRPPADTALAMFSLARDEMSLIPYIKAAQALKPTIKFWASPWTPPVWMKTGFKANGGDGSATAKKPSYFDGGSMKSDSAILAAYAEYYKKFVEGYAAKGIPIEVVSPQNEPGYDQNYPSCLWDASTYTTFIGEHLGPKMMALGVKVMLGTMSNAGDAGRDDTQIATAVLANATAKSFLSVAGVQWGVLDKVKMGTTFGGLPIWATEHKCGNYPWNPSGYPAYNMTQAPNDLAYAQESWGYLKGAIAQGKVTAYNAWNMVLDKYGLGNDTTRHWGQNALLVADGGAIVKTPTYYVFRHLAQYVAPGAKVLGTSGGDAVGFKNPDGSIVAVMYNSGAANPSYVVELGGKKVQFAMPGTGWATVMVKPS